MTDLTFRGYDRAALDAQYNNRLKVPDHAAQLARWPVDGERARATLSCRRDQPYGPGPGETVNVFPARGGTGLAPVLVFIHGGYWMAFDKSSTDFVALSMVPAGVAVVNVDYTLMPGVRMDVVVGQCRAAVGWVLANAASFGGDHGRVNRAGRCVRVTTQWFIDEAFVMTKIEISFATVVGHEDFPVFERIHCSGIDVEIRIKLLHRYPQTTTLQQSAERGSSDAFAK